MNGMKRGSAALGALALVLALGACGGGGDTASFSGGSSASGGGNGSGGGSSGSGTATSFPFTRYGIYGPFDTTTLDISQKHPEYGAVGSLSASKGFVSFGSYAFRGALTGGELDITLGTDSVALSTTILTANDLSWLAPGADGQLIQQCSVVRMDASGLPVGGYPKSMAVMVANTATALTALTSIPAGTPLFTVEDCKFTGATPSGDIATVTTQANNYATVNADGSLSFTVAGGSSVSVSAANVSAALASGGTGLGVIGDQPVPSTSGTANGSYAVHAYSLPHKGSTAPRYALVIQATPKNSNSNYGVVAMLVSK